MRQQIHSGGLVVCKLYTRENGLRSGTLFDPLKEKAVDGDLLRENAWSHVFHSLMVNVYNERMQTILLDLIPEMLQIEKESMDGVEFVVRSFNYLATSARKFSKEDIVKVADQLNQAREGAMTVLEQIREEAYEDFKDKIDKAEREKVAAKREKVAAEREKVEAIKRAKREKIEVAANFLRLGLDKKVVAKNTGLTLSEIEGIAADL